MKLMVLISRASIKKMPKNVKKISNIKNINRYKKRYKKISRQEKHMRNNSKRKRILALITEELGKLNREYLSIGNFMERIMKNNSNEKGESV